MENLNCWRLCDDLSVIQATLLIINEDPAKHQEYVEGQAQGERPPGYDATRAALTHAILSRKLPARIRRVTWSRGWDEEAGDDEHYEEKATLFKDQDIFPEAAANTIRMGLIYRAVPDWHLTTVEVNDLRKWLAVQESTSVFFFPKATDAPDYLDPLNPRYSPNLAAAIRAWIAVTSWKGQTPKQALTKWLSENAVTLGLTDKNGKPKAGAIEETAKIANWKTVGGAPSTSSE